MAGLIQMKDRFKEGDVVVVIFHDHGTRYLGKMFNDDWMRMKGYFDKKGLVARDLVVTSKKAELVTIDSKEPIGKAVKMMNEMDISQIPVTSDKRIVGSLNENHLFNSILKNPEIKTHTVETIMQPAFPFIDISTPIDSLSKMITLENPALLVRDFKTDSTFIITKSDIIAALMV